MAKVDPETPLGRLGVENCVGCTKIQARMPHLGSFRDESGGRAQNYNFSFLKKKQR